MHEYGIDFQSHSCSHPFFSSLTRESVYRALSESKAKLEKMLHKRIDCFAYPYGDYDHPCLEAALRETGYAMAFCDQWALARNKVNSKYQVNRIPIGNDADPAYVKLCLSAAFPWYRSFASLGKRVMEGPIRQS